MLQPQVVIRRISSSLLALVVVVVCTTATARGVATPTGTGNGTLDQAGNGPGLTVRLPGLVEPKRIGEGRRSPPLARPSLLGLTPIGLDLPGPALGGQLRRPMYTLIGAVICSGDGWRSRGPP